MAPLVNSGYPADRCLRIESSLPEPAGYTIYSGGVFMLRAQWHISGLRSKHRWCFFRTRTKGGYMTTFKHLGIEPVTSHD